jgi:hypothetical protein
MNDIRSILEKLDAVSKKQSAPLVEEKKHKLPRLAESKTVKKKYSISEMLIREFTNLNEQEYKFTPEQEKWLGGADRQDPYILVRMPGAKPPIGYFKDPEMQQIARQLKFPESPPPTSGVAGSTAATPDQPDGPDGSNASAPSTADVVGSTAATPDQPDGPDGLNALPPAQTQKPAQPTIDPNKLKRFKELMGKATMKPQVSAQTQPNKPATPPAKGNLPGKAVPGGGNIGDIMAPESVDFSKLRKTLAELDKPKQVDEVVGAALRGIANVGKNFMGGTAGKAARTTAGTYAKGSSAAGMANKAGKAIGRNPVKTAAGTAVAGGALGYGLGGSGSDQQQAVTQPPTQGQNQGQAQAPAQQPNQGGDAAVAAQTQQSMTSAEMAELVSLAQEFDDQEGRLPDLDELLRRYETEVSADIKNTGASQLGQLGPS